VELFARFRDTTLIVGFIAIAKSRVEQTDEIVQRISEVLTHVEAERLVAAPDCGLGLLGRNLARAKLANLCRAAQSV
jgi:5-methyltetrahydropteroyltriglutamate--homocysteine methyltransferase